MYPCGRTDLPRCGASLKDLLWSAEAKSWLKRGHARHPKSSDDTGGWNERGTLEFGAATRTLGGQKGIEVQPS